MAINRLMLRCRRCEEDIPIARLSVGMEGVWTPARTSADEYTAFLEKHSHCWIEHDSDQAGLSCDLVAENDQGQAGIANYYTAAQTKRDPDA